MKDRRTERRHATEPIEVYSATLHGQVLNLSKDGLAIETATPVRPGKELSLKIDGEGSIVTGVVRWARLQRLHCAQGGDSEAIYHAGISIIERTGRDQESD